MEAGRAIAASCSGARSSSVTNVLVHANSANAVDKQVRAMALIAQHLRADSEAISNAAWALGMQRNVQALTIQPSSGSISHGKP
jgi:hypothetical protein